MVTAAPDVVDDVKRLIEAHSGLGGVVAVFVFGSQAWGDAAQGSDIDVMVLLDRDDDFREVQRVRVADLLDDHRTLPMFADIDRIAFPRFAAAVERDGLIHRVVNSVVIIDDGRYQPIRDRATERLADPVVRAELVERRIRMVDDLVCAADQSINSDLTLAILQARLAAEEAATALVEASGGRASVSHLIGGFHTAATGVGSPELVSRLTSTLAIDGGVPATVVGLRSYRLISERLREWMGDPQLRQGLGQEHVAWAEFTYSAETYAEFDHKVTELVRGGRAAEAVLYVDGLLRVPLRINTSKVFGLRRTGRPERLSIPDFHQALRAEPELYDAWVDGLRLNGDRGDVRDAVAIAHEIRALNNAAINATTRAAG